MLSSACYVCYLRGFRQLASSRSTPKTRQKSTNRNQPSNYRRPNYGGFYTTIMEQQAPVVSEPATEEEEKKGGVIFYSRLAGYPVSRPPETASKMYCGVVVPPRPEEPLNCCQSGCVHCVWDIYREDIEHYQEKRNEARAALAREKKAIPVELGGDGKEPEDILSQLDPALQAFIKLEKELKAKRERSKAQKTA